MANQAEKLDQVFRDKLGQHSIQPSKLAWERLESELPKKKKNPKPFWWAAAAVVFLSAIGLALLSNQEAKETNDFVAEELTISSETIEEPIITTEETKTEPTTTTKKQEIKPSITEEKISPTPQKKMEKPENVTLAALTETAEETKQELPRTEREIPISAIDRSFIADVTVDLPKSNLESTKKDILKTEEEPSYRVTILSDGLKEEKDSKLIASLGKTVNQVEGILGKVDQGFGDLQDAKNNLFASLISKKERVADIPQ